MSLIAVSIWVAVGGCERAKDRTAEQLVERFLADNGRSARVDIDRERGSITVDLGGVVQPEGWPNEVPVYPKAERARVESRGAGRWRLSMTSADPPAGIAGYYREELSRQGWEIDPAGETKALAFRARRGKSVLEARFSKRSTLPGSRVRIELDRTT